ncbi:hypothetical protein UACE39S_01250 [Ureibacillus acetophenoni]
MVTIKAAILGFGTVGPVFAGASNGYFGNENRVKYGVLQHYLQ